MKNALKFIILTCLLICGACTGKAGLATPDTTVNLSPTATATIAPSSTPPSSPTPEITPTHAVDAESMKYFNLGFDYSDNGDREKAIEAYSKAIEIDPDFALAWSNRGIQYGYINEHELAIKDFTAAIELDPTLDAAYQNRGTSYTFIGEYDSALMDLNTALLLDNKNESYFANRAQIYTFLDEQDKAILDYLQALHYTSDENFSLIILKQLETLGVISEFFSAQDLFEKGNNYLRNNDFPNAVSAYSEALEIFPLFYYVYVNRGMAYTNMFIEGGNEDYSSNAEADFTAAIELTPLDPNPYYLRGKLYSIRSESDLAISDFEKGLALGLRQEFEDDAKDLLEYNKLK
jgi:tetratricopeptide (TPR) repeat protein